MYSKYILLFFSQCYAHLILETSAYTATLNTLVYDAEGDYVTVAAIGIAAQRGYAAYGTCFGKNIVVC